MGFFRTKKADRYSVDDCETGEMAALNEMIAWVVKEHQETGRMPRADALELIEFVQAWAEWRECRARLENQNQSDVH